MDFKKLFGLTKTDKKEGELGKLFDGIESILEGRDEADVKLITGFAGLLGKVAYSDMDTSDVELKRIRSILSKGMKLGERQMNLILELLDDQHATLFSIEDYIYTRLINETCDKNRRMELLHSLFEVAAADESVSAEEDATLWSIAKGLLLSHREFVTVRAEFKDHLDVLK